MEKIHPRIRREHMTIKRMVRLYCRENHRPAGNQLCMECASLEAYALERLRRCPFQENKSTCAKCIIHCYRPVMRDQIRQVMRYAGPRMLLHHPVLAILHLMDDFRKPPVLQRKDPRGDQSSTMKNDNTLS